MSHKKHICIIVDCLSGGGAEKVAASLSSLLYDNNYKVSLISVKNDITYSYKGDLFNLGENEHSIKWVKQYKKVVLFRKFYKKINADFYIDFRMRNRGIMELLLHLFVFDIKKMIMSVQHYNITYHIPVGNFFKREYSKAKAIVGVSKDVVKALNQYHSFGNVVYLPNFINKDLLQTSKNFETDIPRNSILAIGRLNNPVKQFDKLILSYKNTNSFQKGVQLIILGDGPDRSNIEDLIKSNNLESTIKLLGFVSNPYDYMKHCKFLVLCSKFEGMPLVIIESLAIGTPVISFDCKSGPSELILNEKNGLLVNNQDFDELEKSIDLLQEDDLLYSQMKQNASSSIDKLNHEEIMAQWEEILAYK